MTGTVNIQSFLDDIRIKLASIREAKKLYGKEIASDFSLLKYISNDEVSISSYLALLLNPDGNHAQDDLYLVEFFKKLEITYFDPKKLRRIECEKRTNSNRSIFILNLKMVLSALRTSLGLKIRKINWQIMLSI